MTRITLDAELRSRLLNLTQPLELCDEKGIVIARVQPAFDPSQWELNEPPDLSEEEWAELEKSTKWYTTEEVLKHLESL